MMQYRPRHDHCCRRYFYVLLLVACFVVFVNGFTQQKRLSVISNYKKNNSKYSTSILHGSVFDNLKQFFGGEDDNNQDKKNAPGGGGEMETTTDDEAGTVLIASIPGTY